MEKNIRWDDLRVAYLVASHGSLSRAGEALGITHSTAQRSVGRLEKALGTRLFIRHQRGYQLTDNGRILAERMRPLAAEMQRLCNTLSTSEQTPSGTLRISTVSDFSPFFAPLLHEFRREYPQIRVQIVATDDVLSLAEGGVHAAVRIGAEPEEPDLVARKLLPVGLSFFASQEYADQFGLPQTMAEINHHQWVMPTGDKTKIPAIRQLIEQVSPEQVAFQSNSFNDIEAAVRAGMGIGPMSVMTLEPPASGKQALIEVNLKLVSEPSQMWLVYHKDMRQSARVRALQEFMLRRISA
ncbi:MAG: LysR family transcriptional regulator [Thalassolituus sp.]|jgi:DNA-binding transcriptional LysR family regulator|nr:LysR family transcriptional regulator [Pseudomonadota bacterium]MEC8102351.1 LysR family transcriptional regulator [Pseudomonadota bacterium]MEC8524430.1 LysR family transcriptional regulator [Pseudomonadota bacterium]TNC85479.1 MAG: LysR family transcriptional regulator [Thalassolituus sp.]|tara:strand:- start:480 stop:1370 length:891 start_codon:yes stop_codon:yes gene_type:complete